MSDYRSYEVYQRERVGESTNLVDPRDFLSTSYLRDPFTVPGLLRENYPCYRDWVGNQFWVTRYDDVTSVAVDDANFETRPRRVAYGALVDGDDLNAEPTVEAAVAQCLEDTIAAITERGAVEVLGNDLVSGYVDVLCHEMTARLLGVETTVAQNINALLAAIQLGTGWSEPARLQGVAAYGELVKALTAVLQQRGDGAPSLSEAVHELGGSPADLAATLIEQDHSTLRASLCNLWFLLLSHPEQLATVRGERRLMKSAYLEAVRYAPPEPTANRFTRHEVERFGRLLPQGALIHLSAAAANRDPRQFASPDVFDPTRKDLCQREPRGQFRADGLPAAIMFGYGKPSSRPAVPKDAPRSLYAISRDLVVAAAIALLDTYPMISLAAGAEPYLTCEQLGGAYTCRVLPVSIG